MCIVKRQIVFREEQEEAAKALSPLPGQLVPGGVTRHSCTGWTWSQAGREAWAWLSAWRLVSSFRQFSHL